MMLLKIAVLLAAITTATAVTTASATTTAVSATPAASATTAGAVSTNPTAFGCQSAAYLNFAGSACNSFYGTGSYCGQFSGAYIQNQVSATTPQSVLSTGNAFCNAFGGSILYGPWATAVCTQMLTCTPDMCPSGPAPFAPYTGTTLAYGALTITNATAEYLSCDYIQSILNNYCVGATAPQPGTAFDVAQQMAATYIIDGVFGSTPVFTGTPSTTQCTSSAAPSGFYSFLSSDSTTGSAHQSILVNLSIAAVAVLSITLAVVMAAKKIQQKRQMQVYGELRTSTV